MPTPSRPSVAQARPRVAVSKPLTRGSANPSEETSPLPGRSPAEPSPQRAAPAAATHRPRQRGRPPGKPLSPAELAARRANLRKAHAAPKEVIYRPTARRRAASRANIQRAIAWRRSSKGNAVARLNALKHGLYAQRLEDSLRQLGDDPKEFARHQRLLEAVFVPADDVERKVVRRLAELTWRRLRLFHAQARWEADRRRGLLSFAEPGERPDAETTELRALALVRVLNDWQALLRESDKIESGIERQLRTLLRKRSDGRISFRVFCPRREAPQTEEDPFFEVADRFLRLSPDERRVLWEGVVGDTRHS